MGHLKIVGLTGGIGAGKSAAAQCFSEHGVRVIDTDALAHELTLPGGDAIAAIEARFGGAFLTPAGALDRDRMREHVFSNPAAKLELEHILHPLIVRRARVALESLEAEGSYAIGYALLAVPLLFEKMTFRGGMWRTLVIDCPVAVQMTRVQARSGLAADAVRRIISAQAPREIRLQLADDVIVNTGSLDALRDAVSALHQRYVLASA
jgi:dephospho-CoA kinase